MTNEEILQRINKINDISDDIEYDRDADISYMSYRNINDIKTSIEDIKQLLYDIYNK